MERFVVLGPGRENRFGPSTTRMEGLALWLQRAPYSSGVMCGPAAGEGGAPQAGAECSELLMSVLQVVAAGLFEDGWAAGAVDDGVGDTVGLGTIVSS